MNHVDYVMKEHSSSKNIRGISFFVLKISVVYQQKIYHWCYCMDIWLVENITPFLYIYFTGKMMDQIKVLLRSQLANQVKSQVVVQALPFGSNFCLLLA